MSKGGFDSPSAGEAGGGDPWAAAAREQEKDERAARLTNEMGGLRTSPNGPSSTNGASPASFGGATSKVFGAFKMPDSITPGSTHASGGFGSSSGGGGGSAFGGSGGGGGAHSSFGGGATFGGGGGFGGSGPAAQEAKGGFGAPPPPEPAAGGSAAGPKKPGGFDFSRLGARSEEDQAAVAAAKDPPAGKGGFTRQISQEDVGAPSRSPGWGGTPPATPERTPPKVPLPAAAAPALPVPGGWGGTSAAAAKPEWSQHDDRADGSQSYGDAGSQSSFSSGGGRAITGGGDASSPPPVPAQPPAPTSDETGWDEGAEVAEAGAEEAVGKADASALNKLLHEQLVRLGDRDVDIANVPASSPLFSVKSFYELRLKENLVKGVTAMGFNAPSKIQEVALPILIGEPVTNMVAQSQSGTGKTAAFVLTMLNRVDASLQHPQCLCLAPTYELALQIGQVAERMGQYLEGVGIGYAVRGNRVARGAQVKEQILIGTPGTALDWAFKLRAFDPAKLRVFVLDEADVMISEQGHKDQSIRLKKALSRECQLLLFSATYDDDVMAFAETMVDTNDQGEPPVIITVRKEEQTLDNILQYVVRVGSREEKFQAIHNFYGCLTIGQSIIFCHTKASAAWLKNRMQEVGHNVALITGELQMEERAEVIKRFREGLEKVLITTNVTARGIDVRQVTLVVNYDVPMVVEADPRRAGRFRPTGPDYETYLHRIGRTGRFGKAGIAVNFVDSEMTAGFLRDIETHFGKHIQPLDPNDLEALERIDSHAN